MIVSLFLRTHLEGRINLQVFLANSGWLISDRILRLGVGLCVGVWMARYLGPEQFGIFSFAVAIVTLLGALPTLGLDNIVIRDIVRNPRCSDETLGTAFWLRVSGAALMWLVVMIAVLLLRPVDELARWLVGILAAGSVFQAFDTIDLWFQSQMQVKYTVYAKNAAFVSIAIARIVLIFLKASLIAFAWAGMIEVLLGALALVIVYSYKGQSITQWYLSISRARALLNDSWPLVLSAVAVSLYLRIDQVMLSAMVSDRAVGIYSVAVRLSEVWYFLPIALVNSIYPLLVKSKQARPDIFLRNIQRLFNLISAMAYMIVVPASILSGAIIETVYGSTFAEAAPMFSVLMWAGFFVALGVAREAWLITEGLMAYSFGTTVFGAVVNICLNWLFLPQYGGLGAAFATLLSQIVAVSVSTLLYPKTRMVFGMQFRALFLRGGIRVWEH